MSYAQNKNIYSKFIPDNCLPYDAKPLDFYKEAYPYLNWNKVSIFDPIRWYSDGRYLIYKGILCIIYNDEKEYLKAVSALDMALELFAFFTNDKLKVVPFPVYRTSIDHNLKYGCFKKKGDNLIDSDYEWALDDYLFKLEELEKSKSN
jgi:hypothetical protein